MKILVVSNNYPSPYAPSHGVFVYKFIQYFVKFGHEVTVISPTGFFAKKNEAEKTSYGEELCTVYRPRFISASAKNILGFNTYRIGEYMQVRTIQNTVAKNKIDFDVVYAHFLSNAFIAVQALESYGKPIYAAVGEYNNIDVRRGYYSAKTFSRLLSRISGFVAVSPQIKTKLQSLGVEVNKIIVKPNGVNTQKFYPRDKKAMRLKFNLPENKVLVIFVGRFVDNKGPVRLLQAIEQIENAAVIFVGGGEQELVSDKIVFKDKVPSELIPELLSAADIFALPTLHEGSCNAIVEAMACGLPIVSSDIPEIQFQCDPSFSILVDPQNVSLIRDAISTLVTEPERRLQMSVKATEYVKNFDIKERASEVLKFIKN